MNAKHISVYHRDMLGYRYLDLTSCRHNLRELSALQINVTCG